MLIASIVLGQFVCILKCFGVGSFFWSRRKFFYIAVPKIGEIADSDPNNYVAVVYNLPGKSVQVAELGMVHPNDSPTESDIDITSVLGQARNAVLYFLCKKKVLSRTMPNPVPKMILPDKTFHTSKCTCNNTFNKPKSHLISKEHEHSQVAIGSLPYPILLFPFELNVCTFQKWEKRN